MTVVDSKKTSRPNKYDKIHRDLMNYILSGQMHSTLIGRIISMDHSNQEDAIREVESYVEYTISLLKRAESFGKNGS